MWTLFGWFFCNVCDEKFLHFWRKHGRYEEYKCSECGNVQSFAVQ